MGGRSRGWRQSRVRTCCWELKLRATKTLNEKITRGFCELMMCWKIPRNIEEAFIHSRRKCGISILLILEKPDRYGKTKK